MSYLLKSKPKNEHRSKIISVAVLFLFLVFCGALFPNVFRTGMHKIAEPLWTVVNLTTKPWFKVKNFFVFKNNLINNNTALNDEVASLKLKEVDYDMLVKENQDLRAQLGLKNISNRVVSRILSKPPLSPYDTLVVDSGSREGVVTGAKVYLSEKIIIGTIAEVTSGTSIVKLFSSGNYKQESVSERTGESFEVVGSGGANFRIEVPKDADILWGDIFMYPGSSYTVGSVYYIDVNSQSSFKTIYLRVPGSIFSSEWVFIERVD